MPWIAAVRQPDSNVWNQVAGDAQVTLQTTVTAVATVGAVTFAPPVFPTTVAATATIPTPGTEPAVFRSSADHAVDTQTLSVPAPAGLAVGDREVMFHYWNRSRSAPSAPGTTTGWTVLVAQQTSGEFNFQAWTRIVPSGETTQDTTLAPSNFCEQRAVRVAYYDASGMGGTVNVYGVDTSAATGTSISTDATAVADGGLLLIGVGAEEVASSDSWTPDSNVTQRYSSSFVSFRPRLWTGDEPYGGGGSTTARTFTTGTSRVMFTATVRLETVNPNATATPATVLGSTTISGTAFTPDANASPSTVAAVASIGTATASASSTATPSTVAATTSIPDPTEAAGSVTTPSTVAAVATVGAVTIIAGTGATATPSTVTATTTIPDPTEAAGTVVVVSTVAAVATVPTPAVQTDSNSTASPVTVAAVATVGAVSLSTGSTVSVGTVAGVATVGAATVAAGSTVTPATVAATASVSDPTEAAGSVVTPGTVAVTTSVATPTFSSSVLVSVASVTGVASVAAPGIPAYVVVATVGATTTVGGGSVVDATVLGTAILRWQAQAVPQLQDSLVVMGTATITWSAQPLASLDEQVILVGESPLDQGIFGADETGAYKHRSFAV